MTVDRIPIQQKELDEALVDAPDTVLTRAGKTVAAVLAGRTVVIEELIGVVGDEDIIEETVLEAGRPS